MVLLLLAEVPATFVILCMFFITSDLSSFFLSRSCLLLTSCSNFCNFFRMFVTSSNITPVDWAVDSRKYLDHMLGSKLFTCSDKMSTVDSIKLCLIFTPTAKTLELSTTFYTYILFNHLPCALICILCITVQIFSSILFYL